MFNRLTNVFKAQNVEQQRDDTLGSTADARPVIEGRSIGRGEHPVYNSARFDKRRLQLPATRILCEGGSSFDLLTRVSSALAKELGIQEGNKGLGEGYFSSSVRLALNQTRNSEAFGQYCAVKKISQDPQYAEKEFQNQKKLGDNPFFVKAYDIAHTQGKDGLTKSYIFMELVTGGNGTEVTKAILEDQEMLPQEKKEKLLEKAHGMVVALNEMHRCGYCHGDVKRENFFHDEKSGKMKIGDYATMSPINPDGLETDRFGLANCLENIAKEARQAGIEMKGLDLAINALRKNLPTNILLDSWAQVLQ